jgi:hypothetical protein
MKVLCFYRAPRRLSQVSRIWLLLRSTIMWALWKERLDAAFNGVYWSPAKLTQKIWLGLVDYGLNDWDRTQMQCGGPAKFSSHWCRNNIIVQMLGEKPHWHLTGPLRASLQ